MAESSRGLTMALAPQVLHSSLPLSPIAPHAMGPEVPELLQEGSSTALKG